jgi:hypothetical protein
VPVVEPLGQANAFRGHHELGLFEAGRFQGRQKVRGGSLGHHQHIIATSQELRQVGEVAGELADGSGRREPGATRDEPLGHGLKRNTRGVLHRKRRLRRRRCP